MSDIAPDDQLSTHKKICSFAELPHGWHYYGGVPASKEIVRVAGEYLQHLCTLGFVETDAFCGLNGQIIVKGCRGEHCVTVTVEVDGTFIVCHELSMTEHSYEPGLNVSQTRIFLRALTDMIDAA